MKKHYNIAIQLPFKVYLKHLIKEFYECYVYYKDIKKIWKSKKKGIDKSKKKDMNICEVKGCNKKHKYLYLTHEHEDKYICQECKDKYLSNNCYRRKDKATI